MIFLAWYFIPPLIISIVILIIYHYNKIEITIGYKILAAVITSLGPVGFIIGLLYMKDNFTKDSIFD